MCLYVCVHEREMDVWVRMGRIKEVKRRRNLLSFFFFLLISGIVVWEITRKYFKFIACSLVTHTS